MSSLLPLKSSRVRPVLATHPFNTDLVAAWPVTEQDSSTVADYKNANDISGLTLGYHGGYFASALGTVTQDTGLPICGGGTEVTFGGWFWRNNTGANEGMFREFGGTSANYQFIVSIAGALQVTITNDAGASQAGPAAPITGAAAMASETWTHVVFVDDLTEVRAYVNGAAVGTPVTYSRSGTYAPTTTRMPNSTSNMRCKGVRLWSRALTDTEIAAWAADPWYGYDEQTPIHAALPLDEWSVSTTKVLLHNGVTSSELLLVDGKPDGSRPLLVNAYLDAGTLDTIELGWREGASYKKIVSTDTSVQLQGMAQVCPYPSGQLVVTAAVAAGAASGTVFADGLIARLVKSE